jgi:hypothetical protein
MSLDGAISGILDPAQLESRVASLHAEVLRLSLVHYEHFLEQDEAVTRLRQILRKEDDGDGGTVTTAGDDQATPIHALLRSASASCSSVSDSLPQVAASLSAITQSHSALRSCLPSLPPLALLKAADGLVGSLIGCRMYSDAILVVAHVLSLLAVAPDVEPAPATDSSAGSSPATSPATSPRPFLAAIIASIVDSGKLEQLAGAIVASLDDYTNSSHSGSDASNGSNNNYMDLVAVLEKTYDLQTRCGAALGRASAAKAENVNLLPTRLQLTFLNCRAKRLNANIQPPVHTSRSLPLTPAAIVAIIDTYKNTVFDTITHYTTLFPDQTSTTATTTATTTNQPLFPLLSSTIVSVTDFLHKTIPEHISILPSLSLTDLRAIVDAISFLKRTLRIQKLDVTFDCANVSAVYSSIVVSIIQYGPQFGPIHAKQISKQYSVTSIGATPSDDVGPSVVDDAKYQGWTDPVCLHSIKVTLSRRLASLSTRTTPVSPHDRSADRLANPFMATVTAKYPILARVLSSYLTVINSFRECIYTPSLLPMTELIAQFTSDVTATFAKYDKEVFGRLIKQSSSQFDVRAYFREMKSFWVTYGCRYVTDVWELLKAGGGAETTVEKEMRGQREQEEKQARARKDEERAESERKAAAEARKREEQERERKEKEELQKKQEEERRAAEAKKKEEERRRAAEKQAEARKEAERKQKEEEDRERQKKAEDAARMAKEAREAAEKAAAEAASTAGGGDDDFDDGFNDDW